VEACLRRLGTEYLDLLQLHSPPSTISADGSVFEALERLKQQGKIRYYGVACEAVEDAPAFLAVPGVSSVQIPINLLEHDALAPTLREATRRGTAVIGRQVFASGLLARPYTDPGHGAGAGAEGTEQERALASWSRRAQACGRPLIELALGYALALDGVSTTLIGVSTEQQLIENWRHLAALPLTSQESQWLHQCVEG
jgi:aryl-alcohol dehydrogenase-like predicted oxidoreductase